jgi:Carbonic anhydrases/acetyltransferases, isoleucine patch superfamily
LKTDGDNFWIAPTAVVIGEVKLAKEASIWVNSVFES